MVNIHFDAEIFIEIFEIFQFSTSTFTFTCCMFVSFSHFAKSCSVLHEHKWSKDIVDEVYFHLYII